MILQDHQLDGQCSGSVKNSEAQKSPGKSLPRGIHPTLTACLLAAGKEGAQFYLWSSEDSPTKWTPLRGAHHPSSHQLQPTGGQPNQVST